MQPLMKKKEMLGREKRHDCIMNIFTEIQHFMMTESSWDLDEVKISQG